ncbi:hypothetical protein IQ06DRAFT_150690 [Phaeosphaeriaceae sp. SRC1lsM3a]|nr:hypothetical protein IQ06DRAFT_150690 [Stagonospora sp. SRC1lsM3a]
MLSAVVSLAGMCMSQRQDLSGTEIDSLGSCSDCGASREKVGGTNQWLVLRRENEGNQTTLNGCRNRLQPQDARKLR